MLCKLCNKETDAVHGLCVSCAAKGRQQQSRDTGEEKAILTAIFDEIKRLGEEER